VARASLFNFILITVSGLALLAVRYGGVWTEEFALAGAAGAVLCAAALLAVCKLARTHDQVLEILSANEDRAPPTRASAP
jgi:hypothetical protein